MKTLLLIPMLLLVTSGAGSVLADDAWLFIGSGYDESCPTWPPHGSQIVFQSDRVSSMHIWVIPANGGVAKQVTTEGSRHDRPTWSPDGSKIVFHAILHSGNHGDTSNRSHSILDRCPRGRGIRKADLPNRQFFNEQPNGVLK